MNQYERLASITGECRGPNKKKKFATPVVFSAETDGVRSSLPPLVKCDLFQDGRCDIFFGNPPSPAPVLPRCVWTPDTNPVPETNTSSLRQRNTPWGLFVHDRDARVVVINPRPGSKQNVDVPPKQSDILSYLMDNQGRICTRKEIEESVYDEEFVEGSRRADVMVMRLKALLHDTKTNGLIRSRRGLGYLFVEDPDRIPQASDQDSL